MKKAIVYTPYWDTLGGGEKYSAVVIKTLMENGYEVDIFWNDAEILQKIAKRYDIDISYANMDKEGYLAIKYGNFWHKKNAMWDSDVVFFVSDGSLPFMYGQHKNILHFQVPFHDVSGRSMMSKLKKMTINEVVCNSKYTKSVIDGEYGFGSEVLYPPAEMIRPGKKEKMILSVGRFDNLMHSKRQDVLVDAFIEGNFDDWKLVLAGGVLHGDEVVESLQKKIDKHNIEIVVNPDWDEVVSLYAHSRIYWHAAGYGIDLDKYPEKAEHFGMSTVEAMSAGAVPVVFGGGGQLEIVQHDRSGIIWSQPNELISGTRMLMSKKTKYANMSKAAIKRSNNFSVEVFEREFKKYLD